MSSKFCALYSEFQPPERVDWLTIGWKEVNQSLPQLTSATTQEGPFSQLVFYTVLQVLARAIRQVKWIKDVIVKEEFIPSSFVSDMVLSIHKKTPTEPRRNPLHLTNTFSKVPGYKINMGKETFLCISNEFTEKEIGGGGEIPFTIVIFKKEKNRGINLKRKWKTSTTITTQDCKKIKEDIKKWKTSITTHGSIGFVLWKQPDYWKQSRDSTLDPEKNPIQFLTEFEK